MYCISRHYRGEARSWTLANCGGRFALQNRCHRISEVVAHRTINHSSESAVPPICTKPEWRDYLSDDLNRIGHFNIRRDTVDLLWTIAVILAVLWLLGMVSSYTLGGFLHILLVLAIVVVLIRVIQGRRVV
jgi:Flp pilus assembly protein TadB